MCFQFRPGPSGMCECSFQFRLWSINLKHCRSIPCFVTHFRQLQFKFVGHSSWARDSNNNFVYRHSFSSKFQSKSSPRCRGPIWMTEYWICSKEWRIWSYIPYSPSDTDEFQWQLTNLNAESIKLIDKTWMWMTIWRNWTLDLNAVSCSGRNWIEDLWNWMQRWRKWAGKPILRTS